MKQRIRLHVLTALVLFAALLAARANDRHVLVVVWDGMRPDFISETNTPNLFALASRGVRFANHHPAYVSTTEVNGTAIATGTYPGMDGIEGNVEYRPLINRLDHIHTEDFNSIRKGDRLTGGHYIAVPTTAEILRQKGFSTVIAGAKPVALLHDCSERGDNATDIDLFAGRTLPASYLEKIVALHGPFPSATAMDPNRNDWTTDALLNPLWKTGVPRFSVLWMNEPDASQHATGPGSPKSLAAINNADANLGKVIRYLSEHHDLDTTDIMLVSDHGFSTIQKVVDVAESLRKAGFKAFEKFEKEPSPGDVLVVTAGGSMFLYVIGHDAAISQKLVDFFQKWPSTGVIFTPAALPGTFSLAQAHLDSRDRPDIIVAFHWNDGTNDYGAPGMMDYNEAGYHPGQGMHGSLSRFDMHNTFVAAGPDFKKGVVDELPTGNVDVAPTALHLLGISIPDSMKGRVVSEALAQGGPRLRSYQPERIEATRSFGDSTWHQYIQTSAVNGTLYLDEGNGEWSQNPK